MIEMISAKTAYLDSMAGYNDQIEKIEQEIFQLVQTANENGQFSVIYDIENCPQEILNWLIEYGYQVSAESNYIQIDWNNAPIQEAEIAAAAEEVEVDPGEIDTSTTIEENELYDDSGDYIEEEDLGLKEFYVDLAGTYFANNSGSNFGIWTNQSTGEAETEYGEEGSPSTTTVTITETSGTYTYSLNDIRVVGYQNEDVIEEGLTVGTLYNSYFKLNLNKNYNITDAISTVVTTLTPTSGESAQTTVSTTTAAATPENPYFYEYYYAMLPIKMGATSPNEAEGSLTVMINGSGDHLDSADHPYVWHWTNVQILPEVEDIIINDGDIIDNNENEINETESSENLKDSIPRVYAFYKVNSDGDPFLSSSEISLGAFVAGSTVSPTSETAPNIYNAINNWNTESTGT